MIDRNFKPTGLSIITQSNLENDLLPLAFIANGRMILNSGTIFTLVFTLANNKNTIKALEAIPVMIQKRYSDIVSITNFKGNDVGVYNWNNDGELIVPVVLKIK